MTQGNLCLFVAAHQIQRYWKDEEVRVLPQDASTPLPDAVGGDMAIRLPGCVDDLAAVCPEGRADPL
eukprot:scaffold30427_cov139-Isochrysis_galbana.AAC.3